MEIIIVLLINVALIYAAVSICFWYFLYQTVNSLELLSKSNFKDVKIRKGIKDEIEQTTIDKSEAYKWPKFVYEIIRYERLTKNTKL